MAGIYVHIPFCKKACIYCDFHFSTNLSHIPDLAGALVKEIGQRKDYVDEAITTIYFGGGTPSVMPSALLGSLFESIHRFYKVEGGAEVTLEANPDDITNENLQRWKQLGVNRLSIGLQGFNEEELKWMNRAHNAREGIEAVKRAQDAGFGNITIDLIYGSKFQNAWSWQKTLDTVLNLKIQHISAYNLTIEEKTKLGVMHHKGSEPEIDEDMSSHQFLQMKKALEGEGFVHYEVSNFGLPGFFSKHNSNYWLQQTYIGFGPSAHSFNGHSRQWNVKSNAAYIQKLNENKPCFEMETLSLNDRYNEYVMTRLRTIWGCDIKQMNTLFGNELTERFKRLAQKQALIKELNGIYTLGAEGLLHADGIAASLFAV